jgi:hypothetical protein
LAYLVTGAACKVAYGARQESVYPTRARVWYRRQFEVYGQVPVARLFGRPFALYLGRMGRSSREEGGALLQSGRTPQDMQMLQRLLERYPRSRWADNALYELARATKADLTQGSAASPQTVLDLYRRLVEQYPGSVFAPPALEEMATVARSAGDAAALSWAREQLLTRYAGSPQAGTVAEAYAADSLAGGAAAAQQALQRVDQALAAASEASRPRLLGAAGDLLAGLGRREEARQRYGEAAQGMDQLLRKHQEEVQRREDMPQEEIAVGADLQRQRDDYLRKQAALQ